MRILIIISVLFSSLLYNSTLKAQDKVVTSGFIPIGGIEQWISVRGDDKRNPVILMIHGGPGNPLSPYADTLFGGWHKDFTLVQWDQRGAGRTFGRNPKQSGEQLTIAQMTSDGIAVAEHVRRTLGVKKMVLMGSSWGSALAVHMAKARPDLFHAYIGGAQLVEHKDNLASAYSRTLALARANNDAKSVEVLEALGAPPWTNPRSFGALRRVTRIYENKHTIPAPKTWWQPAEEYSTPDYEKEYEGGEDYSYIQFVGFKGDGMLSTVDLPKLGTEFAIPVYLFHGEHDLVTDIAIARRYFEAIKSPAKEFIVVPLAGHDPNQPWIDAQAKLLKQLRKKILQAP
jgi:pimeloyl-ACP methyl ester carboxylesterase